MNPKDSTPGASDPQRVFASELERVASSDVSVLIVGEHGSGKTRAARQLHAASTRADGPMVVADLGALSPTLIESELFGHEAGAFTGADRERQGRFRRAGGGTLLLNGVQSVPLELQGKLLRVLQERMVEPLGAEQPVPVDVRVVATASRDLQLDVQAGRFREDLYYRLAVVVLHVPPLRERRAQLPELAREIGARVARRVGVPERVLSTQAMERLAAHAWPGNVRELENALERVMVLAHPERAGGPEPVAAEEFDFLDDAVSGAAERVARDALSNGLTLDQVAHAMFDAALEEQHGNLSGAARSLGLSRRAFDYRLSKLRQSAAPTDARSDPPQAAEGGGA